MKEAPSNQNREQQQQRSGEETCDSFRVTARRLKYSSSDDGAPPQVNRIRLWVERGELVGAGCFGLVFKCRVGRIGRKKKVEECALKVTTAASKRRDGRELALLKRLNHENIVKLKYYYYSEHPCPDNEDKENSQTELCCNLAFEYLPDTLLDRLSAVAGIGLCADVSVRLSLQLLRGLDYLHSGQRVVHRDVKPSNILLSRDLKELKICDFGSAVSVAEDEEMTGATKRRRSPYVCSRFYRAPELLLGSTTYGTAVDLWSAGCVVAEMCTGAVLFNGDSAMGQVVEIVSVLGPIADDCAAKMGAAFSPSAMGEAWGALATRAAAETPEDRLADRLGKTTGTLARAVAAALRYSPEERATAGDLIDLLSLKYCDNNNL